MEENKIPILPECRDICDKFALNPLGLLASGSLIITLNPSETSKLLAVLDDGGINASIIGKVVRAEEGLKLHTKRGTQELHQFERDELARFFDR